MASGFACSEWAMHHFGSGSTFDAEITAFFIRDEKGSPIYIATVTRDLSDRRRAEEEREKLKEQLFHLQKMESVGRLAGGVAHDFNNLLTVINGYSQILLGKLNPSDPIRANIEEIHKAGERAGTLTRQLLAFSRKQVLNPRTVDLNGIVRQMHPMLQRLVTEDVGVELTLENAIGMVSVDPHQIENVILNLVINSRDAMPKGGTILLETSVVELDEDYARLHAEARPGKFVVLAVSDNGEGMDEETQGRIFEPFFTTKPSGHGTGLGLSTVQGVVAQSGGHINVYSEKGHGTTFRLYLPAAVAEEAPAEGEPAGAAEGGSETILVVEDMPAVRTFAVEVLRSYGYQVVSAGNAAEALLIFEREKGRVDLVLTDVVMPNVSGAELAKQLAKRQPDLKVLFMSGFTNNVILRGESLEQGVNVIEKPFRAEDLAEKVRAILGSRKTSARVLVIDDEPAVRRFLCTALEEGGFKAMEAAEGIEAMKLLGAGGDVDVVITDLFMPGQEGIETIQIIRKEFPRIGLIAISGQFGGQFLKVAHSLGADALLLKPVSVELLLSTVKGVLDKGR